jgi:hypothetical protein
MMIITRVAIACTVGSIMPICYEKIKEKVFLELLNKILRE